MQSLYFVAPVDSCMGKSPLKMKYQKRGLCLNKDCVMNMTVLRNEYKGGCILENLRKGGGGNSGGLI